MYFLQICDRMKKLFLLILCSSVAGGAFSQINYGVSAGAGVSPVANEDVQPAISIFVMKKLHTNISFGCSLFYQSFFADQTFNDEYGHHIGETVEVSHMYSFIYIMPAIDFGLGKHKYIHLDIDLGPGFSSQARTYTTKYTTVNLSTTGQFLSGATATSEQSQASIKTIRWCLGVSELLFSKHKFSCVLSQKFDLLPNRYVTGEKSAIGYFGTNYITIQVGVMKNHIEKHKKKHEHCHEWRR